MADPEKEAKEREKAAAAEKFNKDADKKEKEKKGEEKKEKESLVDKAAVASFGEFLGNLDKLEAAANKFTGPKLEDFLLPDKEALKRFIHLQTGIAMDDVDLMIDGAEELYKKIREKIESGKEEAKERKKRKEERKKQREERIKRGESTDDIDAEEKKEEEDRKNKAREKKEQASEEAKKRKEKLDKDIKDYVDEMKKVYKDKFNKMIKEVKVLLADIKAAFAQFFRKTKDLAMKLVTTIASIAVAIPAMVLKIAFPPWNIPDAIGAIMMLINIIKDLVSFAKDLATFLKPLKFLNLVTSEENLQIISRILNPVIVILLTLIQEIDKISNIFLFLIEKLIEELLKTKESTFRKATKQLIKLGHLKKIDLPLPDEVLNAITKIFWQSDNRGKLYRTDGPPPDDNGELLKLSDGTTVEVYSLSPDDREEIVGLLDRFIVRGNRVVDYRQKIKVGDEEFNAEDLVNKIKKEVQQAETDTFPVIEATEFEQFVYDIQLPDGKTVFGVSEDAIDYYRSKYILIFENENDFL